MNNVEYMFLYYIQKKKVICENKKVFQLRLKWSNRKENRKNLKKVVFTKESSTDLQDLKRKTD